jgi:transcriptional regulator, MarR family
MRTKFDPFEIAMLIQEIYSEVMRTVGSGLQEIGLTHQQIMIIKLIAHNHNKEINISEICKEMSLTKGTISGIVGRLESAGYVEKVKHTDDKRNTYVIFTEKGKILSNKFRETINHSFHRVFRDFNAEELEEAKDNLIKLRNRIRENNDNG